MRAQPHAEPDPGTDRAESTRRREHTLPHSYYNGVISPKQGPPSWCQNSLTQRGTGELLLKRPRYERSYRGHVTTWLLKVTVLQTSVFKCGGSPLLKAFLKLWTCHKLQGHSKMQPVNEAQSERAALPNGKLPFCSQWDVTAHTQIHAH